MYKNYGDKNFFENGILVDTDHSDTDIDILFCRPYDDELDMYQCGHITVPILDIKEFDSWIETRSICSFTGLDYYSVITTLILIKEKERYYDEIDITELTLEQFDKICLSWSNVYKEFKEKHNAELIDPIQFAIAASEYYAPENFGVESYSARYDWRQMSKSDILDFLKGYMIDYSELNTEVFKEDTSC